MRCVDITDEQAARDAVRRIGEHTGRIDVLHFNPSAFREKDPLSLTVRRAARGRRARRRCAADRRAGGAAVHVRRRPDQRHRQHGGRRAVGGRGLAGRAEGRACATSCTASTRPWPRDGIRAVSVTVRGTLAREGAFTPDRVAEAIWARSPPTRRSGAARCPTAGESVSACDPTRGRRSDRPAGSTSPVPTAAWVRAPAQPGAA